LPAPAVTGGKPRTAFFNGNSGILWVV